MLKNSARSFPLRKESIKLNELDSRFRGNNEHFSVSPTRNSAISPMPPDNWDAVG